MPPLALPRQSNPGRHGADGAARLINCYPEDRGGEGKTAFALYACDGLKPFATLSGGGALRGFTVSGSHLYAVSGRQVFKVDAGGGVTALGAFSGAGPVYMAVNQKATPQILIVGDGQRAILESGAVSAIADTDLQPPNSAAFLNQYFVLTMPSGRFQWSSLGEGTEYNSLDFATAEYGPDGLLRAITRRGELLLFGEKTIEPWYVPGSGSSTFARSGSVIERGCLSAASVATVEEIPVFAADDGTVRALEGYQATRISNHAVERAIRDAASRASIEALAYNKDGHSFYTLSGDDFSWTFDFTTTSWFERRSYGLKRWRARGAVHFAGKVIVGDYASNALYEIDENTFDENGAALVMEAHIPLHAFPQRLRLDELRIDTIPGQGSLTSDPLLMVKLSSDGGKSWGNERRIPMGKAGEYARQVRVNRCGTSMEDGFVISIASSAAVVRAIVAVSAKYQIMGA